jgi:endonuclease YncB( thermonuclease family)
VPFRALPYTTATVRLRRTLSIGFARPTPRLRHNREMGGWCPTRSGRDVVVATLTAVVSMAGCADPAAAPRATASPSSTTTTSGAGAEAEVDAVVPSASPTSGPSSVLGVATWSVVSVVDGDTLEVSGSDGDMTVRLIGVNAPEDGECLADEAAAALRELAAGPVVLLSDETDTDQYGRALRYVEDAVRGRRRRRAGSARARDLTSLRARHRPQRPVRRAAGRGRRRRCRRVATRGMRPGGRPGLDRGRRPVRRGR